MTDRTEERCPTYRSNALDDCKCAGMRRCESEGDVARCHLKPATKPDPTPSEDVEEALRQLRDHFMLPSVSQQSINLLDATITALAAENATLRHALSQPSREALLEAALRVAGLMYSSFADPCPDNCPVADCHSYCAAAFIDYCEKVASSEVAPHWLDDRDMAYVRDGDNSRATLAEKRTALTQATTPTSEEE